MDAVEKVMAYSPPFVYSKITGIKSPTGVEAEGWLITVGGTPKQMLAHKPEFTYKRLLQAAKMAKRMGAQVMGLGAFTKVVGDAGVTVAKQGEIPITTGNSYSASGALWAAADAVRRMGLIKIKTGKKIKGKTMVFGATGAIGSVCCRLLAKAFEEVYMVGRNTAKLLALKKSILEETPDVKVHVSTRSDKFLAHMDVIVTATSGAGKTILDIMKVKPGCVITDVARPLDLSPEDVAKRPDVLLCDEPTGALDAKTGIVVLEAIQRVNRDLGTTTAVITHNAVIANMADRVISLFDGRVIKVQQNTHKTAARDLQW